MAQIACAGLQLLLMLHKACLCHFGALRGLHKQLGRAFLHLDSVCPERQGQPCKASTGAWGWWRAGSLAREGARGRIQPLDQILTSDLSPGDWELQVVPLILVAQC